MRISAKRPTAGSNQRRARGLGRVVNGSLLALLAVLAIAPAATADITTRAQTASFGANGTAFSSFGDPSKLAFDQASDTLYALDKAGPAIHAFDAPALGLTGGNFPLGIAAPGVAAGLRVDNTGGATAGRIYYTGFQLGVLHAFDSTGTALGAPFPLSPPAPKGLVDVAVDSAGNIAVGNNNTNAKSVLRYAPDGTPLASVSLAGQENGRPLTLAFDSSDNLYVTVTGGSTKVHRYEAPSYAPILPPIETGGGPEAIEVDITSDTLYVVHSNRVRVFDATTGAHLNDFARDIGAADLQGVAIDQGTDTVYVSDAGNEKVHVFGPEQSFGDATGTPVAAKEVTDESAVIGATVADNNVFPTNWRLEISGDGGETWSAVDSGITSNKSATVAATGPSIGTLTVKAGGGTYKLGFEEEATAAIPYNASAAAVETALEGLAAIEPGDLEVSGGPGSTTGSTPYTIIFAGALAGTPVTEIGTDPLNLVGAPEAVSATATGLDPNTTYRFRVVTNKGTTEATEVPSASLSFTTVAPPPVITDVGAIQIADTSARLVATIDPRNTPTGYVFEYGTTPALGSSTKPLDIGGGTTPITVSQVVGGLSPDTDYYFRAVATNLIGTTHSPSATFHTRTDPPPPAGGRAYEQVSPVEKNYGDVNTGAVSLFKTGVSVNGDGVSYCTTALFGEPPGELTGFCAPYISRRAATGWRTPASVPPHCAVDPDSGETGRVSLFAAPDFSRVVVAKPESESCSVPPIDLSAPLNPGDIGYNLYRQDPGTDPFGYTLLNPTFAAQSPEGQFAVGGSEDFGHVVYYSTANQTAETASEVMKLYDHDGDSLELATKDTGNAPFPTHSSIAAFPGRGGDPTIAANPVSDDGERIFFSNPVANFGDGRSSCALAGCQLYMREGGALTHDVSASECTANCGTPQSSSDQMISATPSGGHAFFASCAKLTDESIAGESCTQPFLASGLFGTPANAKLYRWDRDLPDGNRLVDLTAGNNGFFGLLGHSDDGETAYFVARNQLVPGQPDFPFITQFLQGASGGKIYRWRWNDGVPTLDYLGPYDNRGLGGRLGVDSNLASKSRMVTPDGRYLVLFTALPYSAGDRDEDADLYRWGEAEGWICVSCQAPGAPSGGNVEMAQIEPGFDFGFFPELVGTERSNFIGDDGSRVFFATPDALLPEDVNGEAGCPLKDDEWEWEGYYPCTDVYEWHDGTLNLISSGTGSEFSRLIGAGESGRDVFFFTRDRLVGWDLDNNVDIYDARLGGGFPEPKPQPPECEGEGCREGGSEAPEIVGAGSAVFQGSGNLETATPNRCAKGKLRRGKRCLSPRALARRRCRRLNGSAKQRCIRKQVKRLRRAQRRSRRASARNANFDRRAAR